MVTLSGYADLNGINVELEEIKKLKPVINFNWNNEINLGSVQLGSKANENIVLKNTDLSTDKSQINVMCYNGKIMNISTLKNIYDMGYRVVRLEDSIKLTKLNIMQIDKINLIIDTYNMNERNFNKLIKNTNKPLFLSSGNSTSISNNKKNSNDARIKAIKQKNGIVGINITNEHLTTNIGRYNSFEYIFRHVDYLIDLIGVDNLCFSVGFDKNKILPWEVNKIGDIKVIENWLKVFYGDDVVEKIMWKNAFDFLERSIV